jgi:transposase, IS30 family
MRDRKQLHVDAAIDVLFCDPHAPWQRAPNENTNGLLLQYFREATDFSALTDAHLDAVADELIDHARKRLGIAKPTEQLAELLLH